MLIAFHFLVFTWACEHNIHFFALINPSFSRCRLRTQRNVIVYIKNGILSLTTSLKSESKEAKRTANNLDSLNLWSKKVLILQAFHTYFVGCNLYHMIVFHFPLHCILHSSGIFFILTLLIFPCDATRQYTHYPHYILISFWLKFEKFPTPSIQFLGCTWFKF